MEIKNYSNHLRFINFNSLALWDVKRYSKIQVKSSFPIVRLGSLITEQNLKIKPFEYPEDEFKILGVSNVEGLYDAYVEKGKNINQPYKKVENGFIVYNPYRVNVGSIGIKSKDQKNEYISPAYVVFNCKKDCLADYLFILLKTNSFSLIIRESTTGSVRQILSFKNLENLNIPLPSLIEQKRLVELYNKKLKQATENKLKSAQLAKSAEDYIFTNLNIEIKKRSQNSKKLLFTNLKKIDLWGVERIVNANLFTSKNKLETLNENPDLFVDLFRGKSPVYNEESKSIILNQKCIRWNLIEPKYGKSVDVKWLDSINPYYFTSENDILINSTGEGTLGRSALVTPEFENYLYDSHILLLRPNIKKIFPLFFTFIFNSSFVQKQIDLLKTSQSTNQTELGIENLKKILLPIPDINTQKKIANIVLKFKKDAEVLSSSAIDIYSKAIVEFEKIVFKSI